MNTGTVSASLAGSWGAERAYVIKGKWVESFENPRGSAHLQAQSFLNENKSRKSLLTLQPSPETRTFKERTETPTMTKDKLQFYRSEYMDMTRTAAVSDSIEAKLERTRLILVRSLLFNL